MEALQVLYRLTVHHFSRNQFQWNVNKENNFIDEMEWKLHCGNCNICSKEHVYKAEC